MVRSSSTAENAGRLSSAELVQFHQDEIHIKPVHVRFKSGSCPGRGRRACENGRIKLKAVVFHNCRIPNKDVLIGTVSR